MPQLDFHTQILLDEYHQLLPVLNRLNEIVSRTLEKMIQDSGIVVTAVATRLKTEHSLTGKLQLKGSKYHSIYDITDLLGGRFITFYTDDVDRLAAMAERVFTIDWDNSVDKRRLHQLDSFGYNSLHYICQVPKTLFEDPQMPELNKIKFELQIRTTLQHAWASINHDTGYKSDIEIPREYMRQMNRLAGMLELADDEFSRIRTELNDYRRRVQQLVQNGKLDDVLLDGETFKSYLQASPLDNFNRRIAAINQAEIQEVPLMVYLPILKTLGCNTLGDVEKLIRQNEDDAYRLARHQLGTTDIDIISSAIGLQDICIVEIMKKGGGKFGLKWLYDSLNGEGTQNEMLADMTLKQIENLPFMNQK